jgi:hypothetical protein
LALACVRESALHFGERLPAHQDTALAVLPDGGLEGGGADLAGDGNVAAVDGFLEQVTPGDGHGLGKLRRMLKPHLGGFDVDRVAVNGCAADEDCVAGIERGRIRRRGDVEASGWVLHEDLAFGWLVVGDDGVELNGQSLCGLVPGKGVNLGHAGEDRGRGGAGRFRGLCGLRGEEVPEARDQQDEGEEGLQRMTTCTCQL